MAYDNWGLDITLVAGADLSAAANQYKFVEIGTDGKVTVCNAATDKPVGVLQNRPDNGGAATVRVLGVSKVQADAALDEGELIGTSADGQADVKTPGTDTAEYVVGMVILAAGAAGRMGTALINCLNPHRAA